jgi:hypothetical protein
MRHHQRSITWQGQAFQFQRLQSDASKDDPPHHDASPNDSPLWAVYRRGEFIGTMLCSGEVTTKDFDVRSLRWLGELLGGSGGAKPQAPMRPTPLH